METHVQRDSDNCGAPEVVATPRPHPDVLSYQVLPASNSSNGHQKAKMALTVPWYLLAVLAVAVAAAIGLAVSTGVETARANHAEKALDSLRSSCKPLPSVSTLSAQPTAQPTTQVSSYDPVTRNCSTQEETVTGSTYTSFPVGTSTYTIYCYEDTDTDYLLAIFTSNFDACMDACSAFNSPLKRHNYTLLCGAVSYLPAWANRTLAVLAGDPADVQRHVAGNCWLKAPEKASNLTRKPDYECHSALLNNND